MAMIRLSLPTVRHGEEEEEEDGCEGVKRQREGGKGRETEERLEG